MTAPVVWTDAMRAILRREWEAGTHVQAIADIIGVSRDPVYAEARRLGLPARKRNVVRRGDHAGWTDALVARLTELWASGLSARLIAEALRPFVPTIGKSSVTGKAQRLGLPQRGSPIKRRQVVVAPPVALPKPLPLPPGAKTLPLLPSEIAEIEK